MPYHDTGATLTVSAIPGVDPLWETEDMLLRNIGVSTALAGGGFVVAWSNEYSLDGTVHPDRIRFQVYDAEGVGGGEIEINAASSGDQRGLGVAGLAGGNFVVAWAEESATPGEGFGIHAAIFDADGQALTGEIVIQAPAAGEQAHLRMVALETGGFAAIWAESYHSDGYNNTAALRGRTFDADGQPTGAEFDAGTAHLDFMGFPIIELTALDGGAFKVAGHDMLEFDHHGDPLPGNSANGSLLLAGGRSVDIYQVLFEFNSTGGPTAPNDDEIGVFAEFYDAAGNPEGAPVLLAEIIGEHRLIPVALPQGGFALGFAGHSYGGAGPSFGDFAFQVYGAEGGKIGGLTEVFDAEVTGFRPPISFVVLADNDLAVTWSMDTGVHSRVYDYTADLLTGDDGANSLTGTDAGETLDGAGGNDTLAALGGDDILIGGAGDDRLDGGAGDDTASYADAAAGVTVVLRAAPGNTGGAGRDTLVSIENLTGSAHRDTLTGDAGVNRLVGGAGDDTLKGLAGEDVLVGGAGSDTLQGGAGEDRFVLGLPGAPGERDRILDFRAGEDHIVLDRAMFTALAFNEYDEPYDFQFAIGRAADSDQNLIFDAHTGRLYYDPDGIGAVAQVEIATIFGKPDLSFSDFELIG